MAYFYVLVIPRNATFHKLFLGLNIFNKFKIAMKISFTPLRYKQLKSIRAARRTYINIETSLWAFYINFDKHFCVSNISVLATL